MLQIRVVSEMDEAEMKRKLELAELEEDEEGSDEDEEESGDEVGILFLGNDHRFRTVWLLREGLMNSLMLKKPVEMPKRSRKMETMKKKAMMIKFYLCF